MDLRWMQPARRGKFPTLGIYGAMFVLLVSAAVWLGFDLAKGRARIVEEKLALAVQQSQFMSQWFGTSIISADYVLRDVLEKVSFDELNDPARAPSASGHLTPWLAVKLATVPGGIGLGLYDGNCLYQVAADPTKVGIKSNLSFCADPTIKPEDRAYIQYVPADKSASKNPAILVSRPNLSPDGRFLGGALIAFALGETQRWILSFPVGRHDVLAVVDGEGLLLAHNPPLSSGVGKRTLGMESWSSLGEQRSSAGLVTDSPLDGRTRIYGLSKIENIPLVFVVGFDLEDSLSEWRRRIWQLTAGFAGLIVLYALALRTHFVTVRQWEIMRELATTDPLTGVTNRRQLVLAGRQEVARALRYGGRLSLVMIDIDRFKTINDLWGHPTGDRVIVALADTMTAGTRGQDVVGRLGGEEFVVLLTETDGPGALAKAERLRETIQSAVTVASDDDQRIRFTISAGVTTLGPRDKAFEDLLGRADKALYVAKGSGRNKVAALWPD